MTRRIFLDIETVPPDESYRARLAAEVASELLAESGRVDSKEQQQIVELRFRELALKAEYGRILAIGMIVEEDDRLVHHGVLGRNRASAQFHLNEALTLSAFWKLMSGFNSNSDCVIGHNLLDFDLPFIRKRSIINNVAPSAHIPFKRFQARPVYDTMWEWNNWRSKVRLAELAECLGIHSPKVDGIDGGSVYDCFIAGRHQEIASYCMRDVEAVREIYYRMNFIPAPPLVSYAAKTGAAQAIPHNMPLAAIA